MIDFKVAHCPQAVILFAVYYYVRYGVLYHNLEEIMAEPGVWVGQATMIRWVAKYSHLAAGSAQKRKASTAESWRMHETYVKTRGDWVYFPRRETRRLPNLCATMEYRNGSL